MKCPNCGANMGLEDKFCPYCGSANPFAKQHQKDMQHYEAQFEATRQEVEKKANRFAGIAVPLTILGISLALLIAAVIFAARSYDIGANIKAKRVAQGEAGYRESIEAALDARDYGLVDQIYSVNDLYYVSDDYHDSTLIEYAMIFRACQYYAMADETISRWTIGGEQSYSEERFAESCKYLADNLLDLYTVQDRDWYDASCLTEEKLARITEMQEQMTALLITYGGLTEDEIAEIPDMSEQKLARLLEEHFSQAKSKDAE